MDGKGLETVHSLALQGIDNITGQDDSENGYQTESLISSLQISSHLARNSESYYPALQRIYEPNILAILLTHVSDSFSSSYHRHDDIDVIMLQTSESIRAKCCNLIGNLCRHSSKFYPILATQITNPQIRQRIKIRSDSSLLPISSSATSLIHYLVYCCDDIDQTTRKFACFAVGNAAFHNGELYKLLSLSISPLAKALTESDDKTRYDMISLFPIIDIDIL